MSPVFLIYQTKRILIGKFDSTVKTELDATRTPPDPTFRHHTLRSIFRSLFQNESYPHDDLNLIRTLLAHECYLVSIEGGQERVLESSFLPVTYELARGTKRILLGHFYYTKGLDEDDQFPEFCKQTNYPDESLHHLIHETLPDGFKVVATTGDVTTVLAETDRQGITYGREATLKYLGFRFVKVI